MSVDRRGFTLTELVIVTLLGALMIAAALQILITNQRTYTVQTAQIQGQQATRAAADVLFNELREVSAQGGDLLAMSATQLTIRSMRKFGIVCSLDTDDPPDLTVLKVGDWFADGDSVFVFADNNAATSGDDVWIAVEVMDVDTTEACGTQRAVELDFGGQSAPFTNDSVRVGAAVRSFVRYTYGLITYDGESYLGRTEQGSTAVPLVGPLEASSGLEFTYLDENGNVTATAADVRQITVTIRTASPVVNSLGQTVSDSITTVIYTRN